MSDAAAELPCPGQRSPVRPLAVVPVCKGCALRRPYAELGPHQAPVAEYDGWRWTCARAIAAPANVSPLGAADLQAPSFPPAPRGAGGSSSF